ncbi:MAG: GAF domain-containing protein, partial [Chloroflexi bacterium]
IILAALLLGEQAALIFGALSALAILALFLLAAGDSLVEENIGQLVTVVTTLGLTTVLLRFALKSIKDGLADSRRNEQALAESNRQLLASREALQAQVAERDVLANALRQKTTQLEHLLQAARQLTSSLNTKEVLSRIAATATDLLNTEGCAIYMLEPDKQTLTPVVSIDREYAEEILAATIRVDNSFTGQAVTARRGMIFNETDSDPSGFQVPGTPEETDERVIAAPFMIEDTVLGAICLSRVGPWFTGEDLALVETFAAYASTALKNAQMYQALQQEVEERKKARRALQAAHNELEQRVEERTRALLLANAQLSDEVQERKRAEEKIQASLQEKVVLLQEIHHRVKNNLQIISSLLHLQSTTVTDPQTLAVLQESQHRVRSMALIHEKLYQSTNLARIDFADYVKNLTRYLLRSYRAGQGTINLEYKLEPVEVGIDAAVPCGLIVNELFTNALKHAFPDGRGGKICIKLCNVDDEHIQLEISDSGVGIPDSVDVENSPSLGLLLVNSLVNQLNGSLTLNRANGAEFLLNLKVK